MKARQILNSGIRIQNLYKVLLENEISIFDRCEILFVPNNVKYLTTSNVKYSSADECVCYFYGCGRGDPSTRLRLAQDDNMSGMKRL